MSPALAGRLFTLSHLGSPIYTVHIFYYIYISLYISIIYLLCLFTVDENLTIGNKAAGCVYHFEFMLLFSSDTYPGMELLGHIIILFLVYSGTSVLFSIVAMMVYSPTNSVLWFIFLHILTNTSYLFCFLFFISHSDM